MEKLHFQCPRTGRFVDVGIDSDIETLLRIRTAPVIALCDACGERHEWRVSDAQLQKAA